MRHPEALLLIGVAAVLSALGVVPAFDNVTHRVVALVDQVPWSAAFLPFEMPWPIDAHALRPLSVLALKSHAAIFGVAEVEPDLVRWARATAELALFGLAARSWLRRIGLPEVATLAAVSSLLLAPTLFQAWLLTEMDLLGAAGLLFAGGVLREEHVGPLRLAGAVLALSVPMLLKESTALVAFGFLGGSLLLLVREGGPRFRRHVAVAAAFNVLWLAMVGPLLSAPATHSGTTTLLDKLPLVEHNLVQLLYLASVPGAALIAAGALPSRPRLASTMALLGLFATPVLVLYSHYEAVYLSPRGAGLVWSALLVVAVAVAARRGPERTIAVSVACAWGTLSLAGLLAPTAREDMASRIFIVLAPLLHALAWDAARRLRHQGGLPLRALAVCFGWWAVVSGLNYTWDWRARNAADVEGKSHLVTRQLDGALMMFNHYVEWVEPWALKAAGAGDEVFGLDYVLVPSHVDAASWSQANWIRPPGAAPPVIFVDGTRRWFYWLAPRSRMDEATNEVLLGDLSWTRRDLGLFEPIIEGGPNRPEDHRLVMFGESPSPTERLLEEYGEEELRGEHPFHQLPLLLTEVPRRLWLGIEVLEDYAYDVAVIRFVDRGAAPGLGRPASEDTAPAEHRARRGRGHGR